MNLRDFDYHLPRRLIAQEPVLIRDNSRLMAVNRRTGSFEHRLFADLPEYLQPDDALVINETKVLPARLIGKKESGGKVEILLVRKMKPGETPITAEEGLRGERYEGSSAWECLVKNSGKLRPPTSIFFSEEVEGELVGKTPAGLWKLFLKGKEEIDRKIQQIGFPPLPPYIRRNGNEGAKAMDLERYQTVYARKEGSIAAPTAGLHFTEKLLKDIKKKRVAVLPLTLHVGVGTFLPVKEEEIEKHRLAPEFFEVPRETASAVNEARASGKKVMAVGTTVSRALESCADENGKIESKSGETDLFIVPGHRFRVVDVLVTNFHLPRSTLLMLVSAFAGRELILAAYEEAIRENYRFYSYGDAMLIL